MIKHLLSILATTLTLILIFTTLALHSVPQTPKTEIYEIGETKKITDMLKSKTKGINDVETVIEVEETKPIKATIKDKTRTAKIRISKYQWCGWFGKGVPDYTNIEINEEVLRKIRQARPIPNIYEAIKRLEEHTIVDDIIKIVAEGRIPAEEDLKSELDKVIGGYITDGRRLYIILTNMSYKDEVLRIMGLSEDSGVVFLKGKYSLYQLYRWQEMLGKELFKLNKPYSNQELVEYYKALRECFLTSSCSKLNELQREHDKITLVGVCIYKNVVEIGVNPNLIADDELISNITRIIEKLGIPFDAVIIKPFSPPAPFVGLQAGLAIASFADEVNDTGICTLGFTGNLANGTRIAITNDHCTANLV